MRSRKIGIILILFGIALILISIFNAEKYSPKLGILGSISRMEVVFKKGIYFEDLNLRRAGYSGRKAIPLKYIFTISTIIVFTGIGFILINSPEKNRDKNT